MSVIETTQALVRIPSLNPSYDSASRGEGKLVDWIAGWAHRHGIASEISEVLPGRSNILESIAAGAVHAVVIATRADMHVRLRSST